MAAQNKDTGDALFEYPLVQPTGCYRSQRDRLQSMVQWLAGTFLERDYDTATAVYTWAQGADGPRLRTYLALSHPFQTDVLVGPLSSARLGEKVDEPADFAHAIGQYALFEVPEAEATEYSLSEAA